MVDNCTVDAKCQFHYPRFTSSFASFRKSTGSTSSRKGSANIETWADPEGGTGGPDPPWNFGKNVLIGFVKWYWFDIAQHLCKIVIN